MSAPQRYPLLPGDPPELLVHDEPIGCPYLSEQTARLPLRLPLARLSRKQLDARLAKASAVRAGSSTAPQCTSCNACEAIRIPVADLPSEQDAAPCLSPRQRVIHTELAAGRTPTSARAALYNHTSSCAACSHDGGRDHGRGLRDRARRQLLRELRAALPRGRRPDRCGDRRSRRAVALGGVLLLRPRCMARSAPACTRSCTRSSCAGAGASRISTSA